MQFDWNPEKNEWLKRNRKISFEEIALLLGGRQSLESGRSSESEKISKSKSFPDPD
jgi:uncharacterized DUF497 family protein